MKPGKLYRTSHDWRYRILPGNEDDEKAMNKARTNVYPINKGTILLFVERKVYYPGSGFHSIEDETTYSIYKFLLAEKDLKRLFLVFSSDVDPLVENFVKEIKQLTY